MDLSTFFQKFDQFADAPDAVAKLRELVLELAMQGKLVTQSSRDEPAPFQVGRIAAQKTKSSAALISEKRTTPNGASDVLGRDLPTGWAYVTLADLVTIWNGRAYSQDELLPQGGTPVLRVGNLFTNKHWYYSNLELEPEKYCDKGDLIFAWSASFGPFIWGGPKVIYHYHIWKITLHSEADTHKQFLFWFLQNRTQEIKRSGHGVSMVHMTKEKMEKLLVMLPPHAEQKRIVAKVDELMALCDRLEAQQQERESRARALARAALVRFAAAPTPANLNLLFHSSFSITPSDLRKSILTLAVQGKLVPQDPKDEPAEKLIGRISDKRKKAQAKLYESVPADQAPYGVPSSWAWVRLGNITLTSDSGWSPQCLGEPRSGENWGVLKVSAVSWGVFMPDENKALPPGMAGRPECEVKAGDFLLSRANTEELVARSVVVGQTPPKLMMSDKIVRFTFPDEIERAYVNLANTSDPARDYYARNASGTSSSMKNIGREVMCNLPIPLPPLAEQRRIVAKMEQLMALVDALEQQLAASRATAEKLLTSLVADLAKRN